MLALFIKGGPLMWPILLCSVLALAVALKKGVQYRTVLGVLSGPIDRILMKKPACLATILTGIEAGLSEKEIAAIGTRQIRWLEKGLGTLSLISVISPLLGLTGTVTGMIQAFQTLAVNHNQINPGMLAGGIWEALLTTAAGLFVAIPAHVICHYLEERLDDIALILKETATAAYSRRAHGI